MQTESCLLTRQSGSPTNQDDDETDSNVNKVERSSSRLGDRSIEPPFIPMNEDTEDDLHRDTREKHPCYALHLVSQDPINWISRNSTHGM